MSDIENFICESIDMLNEKNIILEEKKVNICKVFEKKLEEYNISISSRVKSEKSLKEKIIRKNYSHKYENNSKKLIEELSDIVGIRINCLLTKEEIEIYTMLKGSCTGEIYKEYNKFSENIYINILKKQPEKQKNGKDIYRIDALYKDEKIEFKFEIQIKSSINSLWGEIEHKLFYKNYEYILSQEFYSGMMKLIYENLDSIERQLELLNKQLKNDNNELEESREFLSKLLYKKYNSECSEIAYGCNIDFRTICNLISEIYFTTPNEAFKELNSAITTMSENSKFYFTGKEELLCSYIEDYSEIIKRLVKIIDNIIQSDDVFWKAFINIYSSIKKLPEYSSAICTLARDLKRRIDYFLVRPFDDYIIENEKIKDCILEATLDFCDKYKKYDMFLEGNLIQVKTILDEFVEVNDEELKNEFIENAENLFSNYIDVVLNIVNTEILNIDDINILNNEFNLKIFSNETKEKVDKILDEYLADKNNKEKYEQVMIKLLVTDRGGNEDE